MSVILVAEEDAGSAERIADALKSEGWSVETVASRSAALRAAAARQPALLIASTTLPEATSLLAAFSRRRGGPGAVALVPTSFAAEATAEDYLADDLVVKPCAAAALKRAVRQCLAGPSPASPAAEPSTSDGQQLTSADIFGDVLAEVEAEARRAQTARRQSAARRGQAEEIERRLEETLSGVMPVSGKRQRSGEPAAETPTAPRPQRGSNLPTANEIDDLLDKTLSSLDLTPRSRRPKAAAAKPAAPKVGASPAAAAETPSALGPAAVPAVAAPRTAAPPANGRTAAQQPQPAPPAAAESAMTPRRATPPARLSPPPESLQTQRLPVITDPRRLAAEAPGSADRSTADRSPAAGAPARRATSEPDAADGKAFGEYTLLERIAVGGMAEVWRARRRGVEGFQKTVAIKKILAHLTDSPDFVNMFIDEAKLAAQLNHHNIIQIYDLGKVGDDFFIAMEYVDGKDLRSILNAAKETGQPPPAGLALLIVDALARALDYAHRKRDFDHRELGLVHRDVSPQNVLISYEGEIKLCDFGIVKAVSKASTTQMGALKGKLQYMSPEQAWGRSVDPRSDIFSLGAVLFEVLTGTKLFAGDSEIGVLDAVRECRVRSPREIVPSLPEGVEQVVRRALAKSPEDRYQTAGQMEHDLKSVLDGIKPTPGLKDLAGYLDALFRRPGAAAGAPSPEGRTAAAPSAESAALPGRATPTPAAATAERHEADRRNGDRRRAGDRRAGRPDRRADDRPAAAAMFEASVGEPPPSRPLDGEPPAAVSPSAAAETWPTGAEQPVAAADPRAAGRKGRRLVVAAVATILVLAAAGATWWTLHRVSPSTPAATPPAATPPAATPPMARPPAAAEPTAEPDLQPAAPTTGAAAGSEAFPTDLEQMVAEEVLRRREQMERDFEEKKRRLEEEIAKAREAETRDGSGGGDGER